MAITVQCGCGKRVGVSDALAGKTIKCTGCGEPLFVAPAAAAPAGKGGAKAAPNKYQTQAPAFYISRGKIVGLSVVGGIVLLIFLSIVGPIRVYNQWQSLEPKVNGDVSDVIEFGLKAYLSNKGDYDPKEQHMAPRVDGPIVFLGPIMSFTMPEHIVFRGKTNQGNFVGVYNTKTGDVEADIEYGGYSFGGMVDIAKATGKFHMTGRLANGFPQAEVDGNPIQIVSQPTFNN